MKSVVGSAIAAVFGLLRSGTSYAHLYQRMRPVTRKNIGPNWLKGRSRYMPHQGKRECERRLRRWARIEARRAAP